MVDKLTIYLFFGSHNMQKLIPSIIASLIVFSGTFFYVGRWAGGETLLMALILGLLTFALTFIATSGKITN